MPHQTIRPAKRPARLHQPAGKATHPLTKPRPSAAQLRDLYATHRWTDADIATLYSVSVTTIRRWLTEAGVTFRQGPPRIEIPEEES